MPDEKPKVEWKDVNGESHAQVGKLELRCAALGTTFSWAVFGPLAGKPPMRGLLASGKRRTMSSAHSFAIRAAAAGGW